MAESIRSLVFRLLGEGASLDDAWSQVQSAFPGNVASWSYMTKLRREFDAAQQPVAPTGFDGEPEVKF